MGDRRDDDVRDWLGRIDPMGSLVAPDGKPRKVKHVLPLARLAVFQSIALSLILALTVVIAMALAMKHQPSKPSTNAALAQIATVAPQTNPSISLVPPPGKELTGVPMKAEDVPAPDAGAGELPVKLVAWRLDSGAEHAFGPVSFSNYQFAFAGDNGNVYCVDVDGKKLWSYRFPEAHLNGLIAGGGGVIAYGDGEAIVLDARGSVKQTIHFEDVIRGRASYYPGDKRELVTHSYKVTGEDGRGVADAIVRVYSVVDGKLAWWWESPGAIYWAVHAGDAVYALVRTGDTDLHGLPFPTTEVYRITRDGVDWHKDFGVHYGDSEPCITPRGTLYIGGSLAKQPALLEVDARTGNVRRNARLDRWATGPLRYDDMYGVVFVPGSNMVQAVMSDMLLYRAGDDLDHAEAFDVHSGSMMLVRDYDILGYDHLGVARARIPLGKELGGRPKGGVLHYQHGIVATFGGELVCFDFDKDSAEMQHYVVQ